MCESTSVLWRLCNTGARFALLLLLLFFWGHSNVHSSFHLQRFRNHFYQYCLQLWTPDFRDFYTNCNYLLSWFQTILYLFLTYITRFPCFVIRKRASLSLYLLLRDNQLAAVYAAGLPNRSKILEITFKHGNMTSGLILIY